MFYPEVALQLIFPFEALGGVIAVRVSTQPSPVTAVDLSGMTLEVFRI